MTRIKIVGLCLMAAFAISAVAASSAFAKAEIGRCVKVQKDIQKKYKGGYTDSSCTQEATAEEKSTGGKENKYEWEPGGGPNGKYSSKGSPEAKWTLGTGATITCKKNTGLGVYVGAESGEASFVFDDCKYVLGEAHSTCQNVGATTGEILTNKLVTEVIAKGNEEFTKGLNGKEPAAGEAWLQYTGKPKKAEEQPVAAFECGGVEYTVTGALAPKVETTPNKMEKKGVETFGATGGEQDLSATFINKANGKVETVSIAFEGSESLKNEVGLELRTEVLPAK